MSTLTKQETLILAGAATAAGCRPCLDVALGRALELGIAPQDLARAREIGCMAASRARTDMEEHSRAVMEEFLGDAGATGMVTTCSCSAGSSCKAGSAHAG